ncbi:hypothetical protein [Lysobacter enzymogenes]|uniref:hypothetical protein n=1 Tax=Lysobacter enzymogenes TaxID=69 RepID=UPI001F0CDB42|nr:hypothetical protein [Lysobacter enzymogenes]
MSGLASAFRSSPHHASAIYTKCNILSSTFVPHRLLSGDQFERLALDMIALGNATWSDATLEAARRSR